MIGLNFGAATMLLSLSCCMLSRICFEHDGHLSVVSFSDINIVPQEVHFNLWRLDILALVEMESQLDSPADAAQCGRVIRFYDKASILISLWCFQFYVIIVTYLKLLSSLADAFNPFICFWNIYLDFAFGNIFTHIYAISI